MSDVVIDPRSAEGQAFMAANRREWEQNPPTARRGRSKHQCPVHRDSLPSDLRESWFRPPIDVSGKRRKDLAREVRIAIEDVRRWVSEIGRRVVGLTQACVEVWWAIFNIADWGSGRNEVSVQQIAKKAGYAPSTVYRAIPLLEAAGLLEHQRFCERVPECDDGPPWIQAVSSYRVLFPKAFEAWRKKRQAEEAARNGPGPEDLAHARAEGEARNAADEPEAEALGLALKDQIEARLKGEVRKELQQKTLWGIGSPKHGKALE